MSTQMRAAGVRQKDKSNEPVEVGDAVEWQPVDGSDPVPGLVIALDEHHPALNRMIVNVKGRETTMNLDRSQLERLTGTEAKLTKSILGGDDS